MAGRRFMKGVCALGIFFGLVVSAQAQQDIYWDVKEDIGTQSLLKYKGIGFSFGVRSLDITSNIKELHNYEAFEEGGDISFMFGNDFDQITVNMLGLYYSNAQTSRTINLNSFGVTNNLYFLRAFGVKPTGFSPYVSTGIALRYYKFYGHYIDESQRSSRKQAKGQEPYLGTVKVTDLSLGLGMEFQLQSELEFIHFYAEGDSNLGLMATTRDEAFKGTNIRNLYSIRVGVRFGRKKSNFKILR